MTDGSRVVAVEEIPADSTHLFTVRNDEGEEREAIVVRTDGDEQVSAWLNYCQHYRHIKLDKGSGAELRGGEILCVNHGAMFEADSGTCTYGPCEGAVLEPVEVSVDSGDVYLTDDDFQYVGEGGLESDPADLSSKSNLEF